MSKTYSAAVIGATGKGGYGHRLDTAFAIDDVELVAIADHDPEGLADAGERLGVSRLYRDYRQMLETEKPDFVSIAPSWVTERVPMIESRCGGGVSHLLRETCRRAASPKSMQSLLPAKVQR